MSETSHAIERALGAALAGAPDRPEEFPQELWRKLGDSGFTGLDAGPDGFGLEEAVAVAVAVGRAAAAVPLTETAGLSTWLLASVGIEAPDGLTVPGTAHPADDLRLVADGSGWLASGTLQRVPWGREAAHMVTVVEIDGVPHVALLPRPAELRRGENLAHEPRDTLLFDRVRLEGGQVRAEGAPDRTALRARGALLRAASAAGAMEHVLAVVLEYADTRQQFGQPIRRFQAVQHLVVTVAEASAATALAVRAAVLVDPSERLMAVASAAVTAKEESGKLARAGHQVLGAIGVTREHELPRFTTRLWSWQSEFGDAGEWSGFLGRAVLTAGGPSPWALASATPGAFAGLGQEVPW